ncbi:apyrase-like isoform X1 [Salvia hispanica]|uniref:apyrase-like isoform X1 n=1 Tax=Salvia hispanica TaxID=49212 RepID=UPI002009C3A9|nr:apyrase-like isoform X1 [Salvia hispanica]
MWMRSVSKLLLLLSLFPNEGEQPEKYAVVFDAGSTGSRVHVFRFDRDMSLLQIGHDYELFVAIKPGLSSYEKDPKAAADSLKPLLEQAEEVIPQQLRATTPLRLGATAGLRLLPGTASQDILNAVNELFNSESSLGYKPEWVSVLDGSDEGAYMWVALNYLSGKLGKKYSKTVAVVDLGGGSVQMAYAVSDKAAANAPAASNDVSNRFGLGTNYNLYSHSYLNYGLLAARAQNLNLSGAGNPCITNGYQGTYSYNGVDYKASPPRSGTSLLGCVAQARKLLKMDTPCAKKPCSFDGTWNGGGGDGSDSLYAASYFYDTAIEAGIVELNANITEVRPYVYLKAAKKACSANVDNIKTIFPQLEDYDVPYLCMDLVYEYILLVEGFGIKPTKKITVVKNLEYKDSWIGAAWPLGCAVELLS